MLFGRDKEIAKLIRNLEQGSHTLIYGAEGTGKSALLQELASRASKIPVMYVRDCSSCRTLLEGALRRVIPGERINSVPFREFLIKDLRDHLVRSGGPGRSCLMLDHLPRLRHGMQRLLELLERHFTLFFAVTAVPAGYDLYYWRFERLEVGNLPEAAALSWVKGTLGQLGYKESLGRALADELQRLCRGNPGLISDTLTAMRQSPVPVDDPIRVRRFFIEGRLNRFRSGQARAGRL